ncbi:MAG: glycosyltransferase family 4 protein, partial [Spirochaetales bacterium]|nr:glycosyltransferase family 4 protein [Spirochaetales bacterium]
VDNDDWISKDYFEVLYTNAKKTNADISATSNVIFPEQNRKKDVGITRNGIIKSIKDKSKIIITSGVIWNKIYKREMLTKNHIYFSTRRSVGEDNNFNIFTIILSNFIVTTDKVSYFWSQHATSKSSEKRTEQDLLLLDNYRDILNKLSDLEIPSQQKEEWKNTINERMRLDFGYLLRDSDEDLKKKVLQKIEKYQDSISLKSNFEEQRKEVYDIHSNEIINTASSNTNFITDPNVTLLYLESENPINFPNYLKVGVFIDGELKSLGSCPYIRLYSPLEHLSVKKNFKIFIYGRDDISKVDIHKIMKCKLFDTIIIQRGAVDLETAKIILKKCKKNKIKVIYESDDDLLAIEKSNRNYPHLKSKIEAMDYLIKNSDLLTVTTDVLSERFNNANKTLVVRNYLVKELQPIKNIKTQNDTKSIDIGYYGTLTHDDDLLMIEEPIRNVITKFKEKYDINVNFYIIGGMNKKHEESWFKKIEIPKNSTAFVSFMKWLRNNIKFDIMLAPLKDTTFNNAKSELKYIEYTALGIPGIYSDLPPYNSVVEDGLNGLLAKNNKDWEVKLEKLILDHNL